MITLSKRLDTWFVDRVMSSFKDVSIESFANVTQCLSNNNLFLLHIDECEIAKQNKLDPKQVVFFSESEHDIHLDKMKESGWCHLFVLSKNESICNIILKRIDQINKFLGGSKSTVNEVELKCEKIYSPKKIEEVADRVLHCYPQSHKLTRIRTVLVETLTNAFFYGAMDEDPTAKFTWNVDYTLASDNAVELCHGTNGKQIYLAVADSGGKLNPETYLHWLHRQSVKGENGLPLGIYDTHGRGLFITRKLSDHFFVTVEKGIRSECLMILEPDCEDYPYKNISILAN